MNQITIMKKAKKILERIVINRDLHTQASREMGGSETHSSQAMEVINPPQNRT